MLRGRLMFTLICGLPNAGKTTYSSQYDTVLHLDDFPYNRFLNCNKAVAESDGNIVVEGIYNLRCRRERLLEAVADKGVPKVCIWIDTPLEVCLERCKRGRAEHIVRKSAEMFQPPTLDEGWDEIIIIGENYGESN